MPADTSSSARDVIVDAGRERLLLHGIDALRSQLNASTLSRVSPVSRDTAYRVFRAGTGEGEPVADAIVAAVAEAVHDPRWAGYEAALREAVLAYQTALDQEQDPAAVLQAALAANFEAQFRAPGQAAGWMLQAAALTTSPAWEGEPAPADAQELGRRILESRRAFYGFVSDQFVEILKRTLSDMGRRPRPGIDPRTIVVLIHALADGMVLRCLIEPGAIAPEVAAEAMLQLGMAFTEEGPADDPRQPADAEGRQIFDRMLQAAATLWCARPDVTVEDAAAKATVPVEAARLLFPEVGDLADSLVRSRVVGGGVALPAPPDDPRLASRELAYQEVATLAAELQRLRDLADELPHALAATREHRPSRSPAFVDDYVGSRSRQLAALVQVADPEQLLGDLVEFASQGSDGWRSVLALLRTVGYGAQ